MAFLLQFRYLFILVDYDPKFRKECRSYDTYSMVLTYFLASSLLFCFTMSFLFSLCIVGSPLLRDVYNDNQAFRQRYVISLNLSFFECFKILNWIANQIIYYHWIFSTNYRWRLLQTHTWDPWRQSWLCLGSRFYCGHWCRWQEKVRPIISIF